MKVNHKFVKTMEYMALHDRGKKWILQVENLQQVNKIILWFDGVYTVLQIFLLWDPRHKWVKYEVRPFV